MILSIIIPTYNEEEYLPILLDSIRKQNFDDYEIIIADANSTDRTREIAEEYGCIVVDGGMPGVGRNRGAEVAKGKYLLFLDSDLKLTDDYLRDVIYEFQMERLGIAITQMKPLVLHSLANYFMISVEKIKPHGAGCYGIIVKRSLHEKCGGFNEELTFGEDSDYIKRLGNVERFKVLRNAKIGVSTRRLEEEGIETLIRQYGKSTFNDFIGKTTDAEELNYGFDHGKEHLSRDKMDRFAKESERISKMFENYDKSAEKVNTAKSYFKRTKARKNRPKKRVFYCVCGEGMGHAIRSAVIIDRIKEKGVFGLPYFWLRKMTMTFNDGTFGWFSEVWIESHLQPIVSDNSHMMDKLRSIYWPSVKNRKYATCCQILWFALIPGFFGIPVALLANWVKDRKRKAEGEENEAKFCFPEGILLISFMGIFFYQMLFEARARYLFVFLPVLIVMSICGFGKVSAMIPGKNSEKTDDVEIQSVVNEAAIK